MEFELTRQLQQISTSWSACRNASVQKNLGYVIEDVIESTHSTNRNIECVQSTK